MDLANRSDDISKEVVDAALKLHSGLGPGLLESVYATLLSRNLVKRGLSIERECKVAFDYDGQRFIDGLRIDILVERCVVVEVKSVEVLLPVHMKQTLTYLRLMNLQVGLLANFGAATMKEGLRRVVNNYRPQYHAGRLLPRGADS
jgi:iron complex transport system substrate-binding protein